MPTIHLRDYETEERLLPEVCMCCGEPATVHRDRNFSWYPSWVIVIILLSLLIGLIVALVLTKRRRVFVPLCDWHKSHWSKRTAIILVGFLALIALLVFSVMYAIDRPGPGNDMSWIFFLALLVFFLAWLVMVIVLQLTAIRPTEITAEDITLTGVSQQFIDALDDLRAEERERRRLFRAEGRNSASRRPRDSRQADDDPILRDREEEDERYRD